MAVAAAVPIEDTPEVAAAKAEFAAAFAAAEAGEHAALAPVQGATAYLADLPEVAEAKAAHAAVFDAYTAGTVALPVAPVFTGVQPAHVVEPVSPVTLVFLILKLSILFGDLLIYRSLNVDFFYITKPFVLIFNAFFSAEKKEKFYWSKFGFFDQ